MTTVIENYSEWEAEARQKIAELTERITVMEAERRELKRIIDYRAAHGEASKAEAVNGKKIKDMTAEERKEYNRIKTRLSRERRKNTTA